MEKHENSSDHDLIVVTANNTNWIKEWAIDHEKKDAISFSKISQEATAAHKRLDVFSENVHHKFLYLIISVALSVLFLGLSLFLRK